jgi:hypothetical protein
VFSLKKCVLVKKIKFTVNLGLLYFFLSSTSPCSDCCVLSLQRYGGVFAQSKNCGGRETAVAK